MEIVKMKLSELNPAEYNPRKALKPGDPAYEKLKASILSFGNVEPIVWNRVQGGAEDPPPQPHRQRRVQIRQ